MTLASLVWLLFFAPADGSVYFDTRARIWEFSFGSMVAAAAPWLKVGPRAAHAFSVIGLIALLVFCLVPIGSYPGPTAFFPMVSVSALLPYIPTLKGRGTDRILSLLPLVVLGDISYCVYLVHWPIFVIYQAVYDKADLSLLKGSLLIAVSILAAWVLTRLVDDPIRTNSWLSATTPRKYAVVAVSLTVGLVPVCATYLWIQKQSERGTETVTELPTQGPGSASYPGARVLVENAGELDFTEPPIPDPVAPAKYSKWPDECPNAFHNGVGGPSRAFCYSYGASATATGRVLVAGSSHAQQLLLAQIEPFMFANGLSGYSVLSPACPWTAPGTVLPETKPACAEVKRGLWAQLDEYRPDYAFLVVTTTGTGSDGETVVPGVGELIEEMTARGITVIGVRDNLRAGFDLRECSLERAPNKPFGGCLLRESEYFPAANPAEGLEDIDGFHLIEYRDLYCVDGVCPTIVGNIFVYFDSNHIGGEYAISMAPFFSERVAEVAGLQD